MVETQVLLPIVLGLGLAVMSSPQLTRFGGGKAESSATFFALAIQLLGFAVFGFALYLALEPLRHGQSGLRGESLREELCLIAALALLFVVMALRGALRIYTAPADRPAWQVGVFDRLMPLTMLALGVALSLIYELAVVAGLAETAHMPAGRALFLILCILLVGISIPMVILRWLFARAEISPDAFVRSRLAQRKLIEKLDGAEGSWAPVVVRATVEILPSDALCAWIWVTPRGWYWRAEDAWALTRFHAWAAEHAPVPTRALHMQHMSVFAGAWPETMRGMRLTKTARRLWRVDVWRSHRCQPAAPEDRAEPERAAGLVYISHQQLREAGLTVQIDMAQTSRGWQVDGLTDLRGRQTAT